MDLQGAGAEVLHGQKGAGKGVAVALVVAGDALGQVLHLFQVVLAGDVAAEHGAQLVFGKDALAEDAYVAQGNPGAAGSRGSFGGRGDDEGIVRRTGRLEAGRGGLLQGSAGIRKGLRLGGRGCGQKRREQDGVERGSHYSFSMSMSASSGRRMPLPWI